MFPPILWSLQSIKNEYKKVYETIKNINICMCEPAYNNNNNRQTNRIINEKNQRQMSQLPVFDVVV